MIGFIKILRKIHLNRCLGGHFYLFLSVISLGATGIVTAQVSSVIVDQAASEVTVQGSWATQSNANAYGGSRIIDGNAGKGSKSVQYKPTLPAWGRYNVSIWNGYDASLAGSFPVDIDPYNGAILNLTVTQPGSGTAFAWNLLGFPYFFPGQDGTVTILNAGTSGEVPADAVKFTLRDPEPIIAAGEVFSVALTVKEQAWSWGKNSYGQLGNGSGGNSNSPQPLSGTQDWQGIAAGTEFSLLLKKDGTVMAWGRNSSGQLGNGTQNHSHSPVQVSSLSNVVQVAAGYEHGLALKSDGTVWSWGSNTEGQLGDNSSTNRTQPVQVQNLNNVIQVAAGYLHSYALKSDGTVWAWGKNDYGQLGDNTTTKRLTPVKVLNLTDVVNIGAGRSFGLAVRANGQLMGWGDNAKSQLATTSGGTYKTPRSMIASGVKAADGGYHHTVILLANGTVKACGDRSYGQVGDGVINSSDTLGAPALLSNLSDIIQVSTSHHFTLALRSDGAVFSWGSNSEGELGKGNSGSSAAVPAQVGTLDLLNNTAPVITLAATAVAEWVDGVTLTALAVDDGFPNPPASMLPAWTQLAGPGSLTFDSPNALSTAIQFPGIGSYSVRLTVSDFDLNSTADVVISVVDSDDDGDGLTNSEEQDLGTHRNNVDTDGDGIEDGLELSLDLNPLDPDEDDNSVVDGLDDWDLDGQTNAYEMAQSTDFYDFFNGQEPTINIVSGNYQSAAPGQFLADSMVYEVRDSQGNILPSVPITLSVAPGIAEFSLTPTGTLHTEEVVWSNPQGQIEVYVRIKD